MTVSSNTVAVESAAPPARTRPLYWSIRRELWENRSITVAPLIVAVVILVAFFFSTIGMPQRRAAVILQNAPQQQRAIEMPYDAVAGMLVLVGFLIGVFYCADALHSERRDRSILFWKSLPVSNATTVVSKAAIPLVVLPLYTIAVILVTQLLMLAESTLVLLASGATGAMLAPQLKYTLHPLHLVFATSVMVLWHAPVYSWFLLVSAWARRAVFFWAVLPFVALAIFERIALHANPIGERLQRRLFGWFVHAFAGGPHNADPIALMTPGQQGAAIFAGLLFAAAFIALAVRLRRDREAI